MNTTLEKLNNELTDNILGEGKIISLKILFPSDLTFQKLKQIILIKKGLYVTYKEFEDAYVRAEGNKINRSLTFLKYKEAVKYKNINVDAIINADTNNLEQKSEPYIDISSATAELTNEENINDFWNEWCDLVAKTFKGAKSTLWSYVVIRTEHQPIICSCYLILSCNLQNKTAFLINKICQDYLYSLVSGHYIRSIKRQALRSAISQVMARNMSHNIGSHVLSRMISEGQIKELSQLKEDERIEIEDKISKNNGRINDSKFQYLGPHPTKINNTNGHNVRARAAYFNSYLKSRMDYLADIATGTPTLESPKMFYNELLSGLDKNRILLDRISGVSDFPYRIILHDCINCPLDKKADEVEQANSAEGYPIQICEASSTCDYISEDSKNDNLVSIPNDILGCHAFYVIMENIIRNTAKHAKQQKGKVCEFHIEVRECNIDQTMYEVQIYDTCEYKEETPECFNNEEKEELQIFIKDNDFLNKDFTALEKLVIEQNRRLNESILDPKTNRVRQGAWGLIEMAVSAGYLRKIPIEEVDDKRYHIDLKDIDGKGYDYKHSLPYDDFKEKPLNILKAFQKKKVNKEGKEKYHLGYQLFLMKPKELLVVLDDQAVDIVQGIKGLDWKRDTNTLRNNGIWIFYYGEKKEAVKKGLKWLDMNKIYPHELLVDMTESHEIYKLNSFNILPDRKIKTSYKQLMNILESNNKGEKIKAYKAQSWKTYIKQKLEDSKLGHIIIENLHSNSMGSFIFDDTQFHMVDYKENKNKFTSKFEDHGKNWGESFKQFPQMYQFLEVASNVTNLSPILKRSANKYAPATQLAVDNPNFDETFYYKLCDSMLSQVVIIDERIQEACYSMEYKPQNSNYEIPYYQLYAANGIYVPSPYVDYGEKSEINLNFSATSFAAFHSIFQDVIKDALHGKEIKVKGKNDSEKTINFTRIRFIVIHLGIIEKLLNADNKNSNRSIIDEYIFGHRKENDERKDNGLIPLELSDRVKVIIISGRGKPDNLPKEIPFLNFSALAQYCIDIRNKILLNELLSSTRKLN